MRLYDVDRPVLGYISGPVGPDSESGDAVFTVKGGLFDIKSESGNNHIVDAATGSDPSGFAGRPEWAGPAAALIGCGCDAGLDRWPVIGTPSDRTPRLPIEYVGRHHDTRPVEATCCETGGTARYFEAGERSDGPLPFSTEGHSGYLMPIFAYGAEASGPIMKNTDTTREIETPMQHGK